MIGIITSQDITRVILHSVLNRDLESEVYLHSARKLSYPESQNTRKQFALLRSTCKLWKDIVDGFTDWLTEDDLLLAVRGCKVDSVRFLLTRRGLDPSVRDNKPIRTALRDSTMETVRLLLSDPRVDPSARNNEAFREAASEGYHEVIQLLLADSRVDPSTEDNEAFREAAAKGHHEVVQLLLADPRVDPSVCNQDPIKRASSDGHAMTVQLLLTNPCESIADKRDHEQNQSAKQDTNIPQIKKCSLCPRLAMYYVKDMILLLSHLLVDGLACDNEAMRHASEVNPTTRTVHPLVQLIH
ncbi:putative ankyrin repeat-containing protein [Planoprotostelium fungivorum]|uniref:Putative ankyrin repeat-containing protein n=1 Tax=Planoprotostelium fungivorum TaxID=1890364 RepID=A0A2P6N0Q2_9EUKA|nr:putative ankyrin repeat-containing protein [Planoprotostelium fungivorum]